MLSKPSGIAVVAIVLVAAGVSIALVLTDDDEARGGDAPSSEQADPTGEGAVSEPVSSDLVVGSARFAEALKSCMKLAGFTSPAGSAGYPSGGNDNSPYLTTSIDGPSPSRGVSAHAPNGEFLYVNAFETSADARGFATDVREKGYRDLAFVEGDRVVISQDLGAAPVSSQTTELVEGCFE